MEMSISQFWLVENQPTANTNNQNLDKIQYTRYKQPEHKM